MHSLQLQWVLHAVAVACYCILVYYSHLGNGGTALGHHNGLRQDVQTCGRKTGPRERPAKRKNVETLSICPIVAGVTESFCFVSLEWESAFVRQVQGARRIHKQFPEQWMTWTPRLQFKLHFTSVWLPSKSPVNYGPYSGRLRGHGSHTVEGFSSTTT